MPFKVGIIRLFLLVCSFQAASSGQLMKMIVNWSSYTEASMKYQINLKYNPVTCDFPIKRIPVLFEDSYELNPAATYEKFEDLSNCNY